MSTDNVPDMDVAEVRAKLGEKWGLGRDATKAELARALLLSPRFGGDHIAKLESGKTNLSGPIAVALQSFLDGYVPRHMGDVVKEHYPRRPAT